MKFTGDCAKIGISSENKVDCKSKPAAVSLNLKYSVQTHWIFSPGHVSRMSSQFKVTLLAVQPKQKRKIT